MKGNDKFWFFWEQNYNPNNNVEKRLRLESFWFNTTVDRVHNKQIDV